MISPYSDSAKRDPPECEFQSNRLSIERVEPTRVRLRRGNRLKKAEGLNESALRIA